MLKGHVFSKQIFENPIFALFINTFLDGKNGVSNNYKNGMAVTYSGNLVTIDSGAICIQGRFLEEDTYTTVTGGTDDAYCSLVIEINLDNENTDSNFTQGSYKIVKGINNYPYLTKTNIVKNNAGIYQYELARFKTSANGISDFQDRRTFLDFESIYTAIQNEYNSILEQLKQELSNVQDGSAYILKNNIISVNGTVNLEKNSEGNYQKSLEIAYPDDFNIDNTIILAVYTVTSELAQNNLIKTLGSLSTDNNEYVNGSCESKITLFSSHIALSLLCKGDNGSTNLEINYELVLLKK